MVRVGLGSGVKACVGVRVRDLFCSSIAQFSRSFMHFALRICRMVTSLRLGLGSVIRVSLGV